MQTKRPKLRVFYQNDANGIANSEDPDQTAHLGGDPDAANKISFPLPKEAPNKIWL